MMTCAASVRGQQLEVDREQHDEHQPDPEGRQAETEDRAGHDRLAAEGVRSQPGPQAERNADHHGQEQRHQRQLEGRRHAEQDDADRRLVEHERPAEIAVQRVQQEASILLPQRPVEAERGGRALDLLLGRLGRDQDVDRVADREHADEHEQRHDEEHDHALHQPPDQKDGHVTVQA
jgi:hypothetical protein